MSFSRRVARLEVRAAEDDGRECGCVHPVFRRTPPDGSRPTERCPRCRLPRQVIWVLHAPNWLMPGGPPDPPWTGGRRLEECTLFVPDERRPRR